jgi:antitoxin component YwqK of YwqJK toxin-antitoxin module
MIKEKENVLNIIMMVKFVINVIIKMTKEKENREGEYIGYYENDNIDEKCYYKTEKDKYYYKNDKREGECIEYYNDGKIYFKSDIIKMAKEKDNILDIIKSSKN